MIEKHLSSILNAMVKISHTFCFADVLLASAFGDPLALRAFRTIHQTVYLHKHLTQVKTSYISLIN